MEIHLPLVLYVPHVSEVESNFVVAVFCGPSVLQNKLGNAEVREK